MAEEEVTQQPQQDSGQQEQAGQAPAENGQQADPIAALNQRFDELAARVDQAPADDQGYDQGYEDPNAYDPNADPNAYDPNGQFDQQGYEPGYDENAQQADPALAAALDQMVSQRLAPLQQQQEEMRRGQEAAALMERYPELREDEFSQKLVSSAQQTAAQMAQQYSNPQLAQLGSEPGFIALVYKAQKADEAAARETPAGAEQQVALEGAGAAGQAPAEDDTAQRIVNAGTGNTFWTG